ncbi:acetate/propionate family kinase [Companilactobacillus baiquanensis]|uniref:Acetate kinase n=1 Tax=Companilactobacillus baiquanensis TaxID=2486005 RepID=A0ABW1UWB4_9LACO|nr:acetate kinase [Companilactobacillus baiquanensis]
MSKIIAVNSGSSTLKWKLYDLPEENVVAKGMVDRLGLSDSVFEVKYNGEKFSETGDIPDHITAVNKMLKKLIEMNIISDYSEITGVGHRVVAGGSTFKDSTVVTPEVIEQIKKLAEFAPLHNPGQAAGMEAFEKILPDVPQVAVFDTSFHQSMDPVNYLYSIPYEYYEKYGVRKFGAHGTSHRYVSGAAAKFLGKPVEDLKMISLHLGSGASIDAIDGGKSVDTSMGFTPLAGITMSTRSGDIDPSLMAYLMQKLKLSNPQDMIDILNEKSGLLGISGVSPDMRDLIATKEDNKRSQLAIDIFVNRIVKYVGSYMALLGGADVLIFTAGMGFANPWIRQIISEKFAYMGIKIDKDANENGKGLRKISTDDSSVTVLAIPTDEELMIVRDVVRLTK